MKAWWHIEAWVETIWLILRYGIEGAEIEAERQYQESRQKLLDAMRGNK